MEPWQMRDWFADYLDALNRHDLDALRSFVDPTVRRAHRPGGVDPWMTDLADLFAAFPDWRWKRIQLVIEEDRIAAHLRGSGTHAVSRKHVNVAEFGFYRLANGRIVEFTGNDEISAQLG